MVDTPEPAPVRGARALPAMHALAWYREAMRLWKRGPATFAVLALATIAVEFTLNLIPSGGVLLAQIDSLDRLDAAVGDGEVLQLQQWFAHAAAPFRC